MMPNAPISNVGARVDLDLRTGADFQTTIAFTNPDMTPVDLTGASVAAQLRKLPLDADLVASYTLVIRSPATLGLIDISMPKSVTATIPCANSMKDGSSRYAWDLRMLDASGAASTPLYGSVRIAAGTTR